MVAMADNTRFNAVWMVGEVPGSSRLREMQRLERRGTQSAAAAAHAAREAAEEESHTRQVSTEDVKIMVKAFLAEGCVEANRKAWLNATQSEHVQRMAITHAQRPN